MTKVEWVNYSGAAPILLPASLLPHWRGFYLPAREDAFPDLELSEGPFTICDEFDFVHPKTDYDRACALGGVPAVQPLPVGPGFGLVFATERDRLTWDARRFMIVNGGSLPKLALLRRVEWSEECRFQTTERDFVLMNACDHGANPDRGPYLAVHLPLGLYIVQRGQYGWTDNEPSLILFRFVRQE